MLDIRETKEGDIIEVETLNSRYRFQMIDPKVAKARLVTALPVLAGGNTSAVHAWAEQRPVMQLVCLNPTGEMGAIIVTGGQLQARGGRTVRGFHTSPILKYRVVDPTAS